MSLRAFSDAARESALPPWPRLAIATLTLLIVSCGGVALTRAWGDIASLWLADGVVLGLLLTTHTRYWAAYLLCAHIANSLANLMGGDGLLMSVTLPLCNTVGVLYAAVAIHGSVPDASDFTRRRVFGIFVAHGVVIGPVISAVLGSMAVHAFVDAPFVRTLKDWFPCVSLGTAIMTPFIVQIRTRELFALFKPQSLGLSLGLLGLMMMATAAVFLQSQYPLMFLLCPLLMVVVAHLGFAGAALAICIVGVISTFATLQGHGPVVAISGLSITGHIAFVQLFLAAMVSMTLPAAVTLSERERLRSELQRANDVLRAMAMTDSLTGLANRRYIDEMLEREWKRAARDKSTLSVLLVDVDYFKMYNDYYGHPAGDASLRAVAGALKLVAARASDICGRYGGEEFIVVLPDTSAEGALAIAEAIKLEIEELQIEHVRSPAGRITVSAGMASSGWHPGMQAHMLVESADRALYSAKGMGRNRVVAASSY